MFVIRTGCLGGAKLNTGLETTVWVQCMTCVGPSRDSGFGFVYAICGAITANIATCSTTMHSLQILYRRPQALVPYRSCRGFAALEDRVTACLGCGFRFQALGFGVVYTTQFVGSAILRSYCT